MLVTFSTDSYPNITLFGNDALTMLRMMGHSATVPGSIPCRRCSRGARPAEIFHCGEQRLPPPGNAGDEDEPGVSTAHRAMPLIELLTAAAKANDYVMWDKSTIIK